MVLHGAPLLVHKNKLQQIVKQMFPDANIEGNFTNHSLRATCATQLFDSRVSEALVQKQTEHKSIESLSLYEPVTNKQRKVVSDFIQHVVDPDSAYSPSKMSIFDSIIV